MVMERRKFLRALVCVPAAPTLLRGMSWAAPTEEEIRHSPLVGGHAYSAEVPPGTILPYAGQGCPPGFLPCDGRAVPQIAFRRLYEAIGGAYGVVPARRFRWRRFRVPDLRASERPAAAVAHDWAMGLSVPQWGYVIRT